MKFKIDFVTIARFFSVKFVCFFFFFRIPTLIPSVETAGTPSCYNHFPYITGPPNVVLTHFSVRVRSKFRKRRPTTRTRFRTRTRLLSDNRVPRDSAQDFTQQYWAFTTYLYIIFYIVITSPQTCRKHKYTMRYFTNTSIIFVAQLMQRRRLDMITRTRLYNYYYCYTSVLVVSTITIIVVYRHSIAVF